MSQDAERTRRQISRRTDSTSPPAVRKESLSTVRGAPMTTRGAP